MWVIKKVLKPTNCFSDGGRKNGVKICFPVEKRVQIFPQKFWKEVLKGKGEVLKLPFLTSYFRGWETLQSSSAALVLYEDAGTISSFAYGSVENFSRLYFFVFNPLHDHLQFSLLIQGVLPPPEVVIILKGLRASWQLPDRLSPYTYVHQFFPSLSVFDDIHQQQLSSFTLFHSWGNSLIPITLDMLSLLPVLSSLFEQSTDTPMWCPDSLLSIPSSPAYCIHATLQPWSLEQPLLFA